jgi:hypothetical protein
VSAGAGGAERAAFALALGLALAGLRPAPAEPPCASAGEVAGAGAWTAEVGCDGVGGELRGPARLLFGAGIDPNRADLATLRALPGIGPARAEAIAEARSRSPFCATPDLDRVKGIGPKLRARLESWLQIVPDSGCDSGSH